MDTRAAQNPGVLQQKKPNHNLAFSNRNQNCVETEISTAEGAAGSGLLRHLCRSRLQIPGIKDSGEGYPDTTLSFSPSHLLLLSCPSSSPGNWGRTEGIRHSMLLLPALPVLQIKNSKLKGYLTITSIPNFSMGNFSSKIFSFFLAETLTSPYGVSAS